MLWFISRQSHNELVALLREEIAELKAERKQTLDYILEASVGRGLFTEVNRPVPIQEVQSAGYFARPTNEPAIEEPQPRRHARSFIRELQKKANVEANQMLSDAERLVQETLSEGREAANA